MSEFTESFIDGRRHLHAGQRSCVDFETAINLHDELVAALEKAEPILADHAPYHLLADIAILLVKAKGTEP